MDNRVNAGLIAWPLCVLIASVLAFFCLGFMAGCSYGDLDSSGSEGVSAQTSESASQTSGDSVDGVVKDAQEGNKASSSKKSASGLSVSYVNDFSDGVAWVATGTNSNSGKVLVSADGEILIDQWGKNGMAAEPSKVSQFSSGACVAEWGSNLSDASARRSALMDKYGKEIWSSDNEGAKKAEEVYGSGVVESVCINSDFGTSGYHGYAAVEFNIDTLNYTGTLSGVIDSAGKWVVEPTPIASNDKGDETWSYHEYVMCSKLHAIVYRTGTVMEQTGKHDVVNPYSLKFDGKELERVNEWEEFAAAHSGMKYKKRMVGESGSSGYLDANENLVFKPDFGKLSADCHDFSSDGYAVVDLQNSGKGKYVTCIDTNGNQLFEPIKVSSHGDLTSVAFFYVPEDGTNGYYLTPQGEKLGSAEGKEGTEFYCNRAWLKIDGSWHCISEAGEMVF